MISKKIAYDKIRRYKINLEFDTIGSPILIACLKRDLDLCKWLFNNGYENGVTKLNVNKRCPLTVACCCGSLEIAKWLYENGADKQIYSKDKNYHTPIYSACRENNLNIIEWLYKLNLYENINDKDINGKTPQYYICNHDREEIAKFIIKNGIIINNYKNYNIYFNNKLLNWALKEVNNYNSFYEFLNCISKSSNMNKINDIQLVKHNIYTYCGILNYKYISNIEKYILHNT